MYVSKRAIFYSGNWAVRLLFIKVHSTLTGFFCLPNCLHPRVCITYLANNELKSLLKKPYTLFFLHFHFNEIFIRLKIKKISCEKSGEEKQLIEKYFYLKKKNFKSHLGMIQFALKKSTKVSIFFQLGYTFLLALLLLLWKPTTDSLSCPNPDLESLMCFFSSSFILLPWKK